MPRERLSLKARALQWLAQREHSRPELKRKLMRAAREEQARRLAAAAAGADGEVRETGAAAASPAEDAFAEAQACEHCVEQLLDWLQQHRYLSEARFVESRVHVRSARYGNLRIRQELAQHGLALDEAASRQLQASEFERARAVWQRKFGAPPADPRERARQMRFLAQRGFSADAIRRVLGAADEA